MASKGQKFKKYPPELKAEIVEKYSKGRGYRSLARDYPDIPVQTINTWTRKIRNGIDIRTDHRPNHSGKFTKRKNLTLEDYRERYEILKKYQAFLQARQRKK